MQSKFALFVFLATLTLYFGAGSLGAVLFAGAWGRNTVDLDISLIIYLIVASIVVVSSLGQNKKQPNYRFKRIQELKVWLILFAISFPVVLMVQITGKTIPLYNIFSSIVIVTPAILLVSGSPRTALLIFALVILTFALTSLRVHVVLAALMFFTAYVFTGGKEFLRPAVALCLVVVGISFLKSEISTEETSSELPFIVDLIGKLGGEWRDGIFVHDRLSDYELKLGWRAYIQSITTIVPASGAMGLISYKDIYPNLIGTSLVKVSGLADKGYTGLRVGIIWELYMMFGYLGVTVYGFLIGLIIRVVNGLRRCSLNLVISGFLLSACCYSVIGQIDFLFGVIISGMVSIVILKAIVESLLLRRRRPYD